MWEAVVKFKFTNEQWFGKSPENAFFFQERRWLSAVLLRFYSLCHQKACNGSLSQMDRLDDFRKHSVQRGHVRGDTVWSGTTHCSPAILSKLPFKNSSLLLLAFTPVVNNHWSLWLDPLTWRPFEKQHPVVFGLRLHLSWPVTTGQEMQQSWPDSAGSEHLPQVHTFESLEKAFVFCFFFYVFITPL